MSILYPSFAQVLINTNSTLFIDGEYVLSQESTTQGDPLAMPLYAIGVVPLICQLGCYRSIPVLVCYDASACGSFSPWALGPTGLFGPDYGCFPNAVKTCLIVKLALLHQAKAIFFIGLGL